MGTFVEQIGIVVIFVLCSSAVVSIGIGEVSLWPDVPYMSAPVSGQVELKCCFNISLNSMKMDVIWVKSYRDANKTMGPTAVSNPELISKTGMFRDCVEYKIKTVTLNDSGLYQCLLKVGNDQTLTHGTYLQVYKPLDKTLNLSESTKNKILTAEGILLLLCVLLPSATLLLKSKRVNSLEKKKVYKEEENIYQGLNLDDCCTTYDQIERSQAPGPYQDVCNIIEEEEEIQLEKP